MMFLIAAAIISSCNPVCYQDGRGQVQEFGFPGDCSDGMMVMGSGALLERELRWLSRSRMCVWLDRNGPKAAARMSPTTTDLSFLNGQ